MSLTLLYASVGLTYAQHRDELQWADSVRTVLWNETVADFDRAILLCDSILQIYDTKHMPCEWISATLTKNQYLRKTGRIEEALQNCINCQQKFTPACDSSVLIPLFNSMASVRFDMQQYHVADSIASYALSLYSPKWGNPSNYAGILINSGAINIALGNFDNAKKTFKKCINHCRLHNEHRLLQDATLNLGITYAITNDLDSAHYFILNALKLARHRNELEALGQIYNAIAGIMESPDVRMQYMDSAMFIAQKLGDVGKLATYSENIAYEYYDQKKYEIAFGYLEDHILFKDSFLNVQKLRALADIEKKYESEKRKAEIQKLQIDNLDSEIKRQSAERGFNQLLFGIGVLGLFIFFGMYRFVLVRKNKNVLQAKNKEIAHEMQRSDSLLLNILPAQVAEELKNKGSAEARGFDNVSVMFSDYKEFTRISEKLSAKEIVAELDHCFKAFDSINKKYSVEKIKTIGDSYMAAGGIPDPDKCPTSNIILAAIEMRDFMEQRKLERQKLKQPVFEMRIGIHTGSVVAGIVGSDKFQYDIWGDTVNIAKRVETSGVPGKVNISAHTFNQIKSDPRFKFESRGKIAAKSKGELEMFFVELNGVV